MKNISSIVILFLLLTPFTATAAGDEDGGRAASFLRWGAGSKAIALGNTFTGIADDGAALFWNPAGLTQLTRSEVLLMHGLVFEDRQANFAALTFPFSGFALSAGWMRFGTTDIQERDFRGELIGDFDDAENLFLVAGGMDLIRHDSLTLRAGLAGRYFYQSLYNVNGSGFGFDVGAMLDYGMEGLLQRLGAAVAVQNIGAVLTWNTASSHKDDVPLCTRVGLVAEMRDVPLVLAADLEKNGEQDLRIHAGLQYTWQVLALRIGLNHETFTAGVGVAADLDVVEIGVDYAYTTDEISEKALHFISLRGRF